MFSPRAAPQKTLIRNRETPDVFTRDAKRSVSERNIYRVPVLAVRPGEVGGSAPMSLTSKRIAEKSAQMCGSGMECASLNGGTHESRIAYEYDPGG